MFRAGCRCTIKRKSRWRFSRTSANTPTPEKWLNFWSESTQKQVDCNWPVFWKPQSGFSVEDLPSNLLLFFQTVEGIRHENIVKWARPLTKKESLSVFREAGGLGTNRTFDPVFFNSKSRTASKCCPNPKWPARLNTIKPATDGFRP